MVPTNSVPAPAKKPFIATADFLKYLYSNNLWNKRVKKAYKISVNTHKDVIRDDGESYLEQHIFPITIAVINEYQAAENIEDIIITSLLHDTIEDSKTVGYVELLDLFGDNIASAVKSLSKPKFSSNRTIERKHLEHKMFVEQLRIMPRWVQVIKIIDRINNLSCTEAHRRAKQYIRFLKDTKDSYLPLASEISEELFLEMKSIALILEKDLYKLKAGSR